MVNDYSRIEGMVMLSLWNWRQHLHRESVTLHQHKIMNAQSTNHRKILELNVTRLNCSKMYVA